MDLNNDFFSLLLSSVLIVVGLLAGWFASKRIGRFLGRFRRGG
jgi:hypothetical protein